MGVQMRQLGLLIFIFVWCSAASSFAASKTAEVLVVGSNVEYYPYEFKDSKGEVSGFDIDMMKEIAAKMGKSIVFYNMDFDALIVALQKHRIDLAISGMDITPDRLKEVNMVPYYNNNHRKNLAWVFWGDEAFQGVSSVKELLSKQSINVAAQIGVFYLPYLYSVIQPEKIKTFSDTMEMVMSIRYGKASCAVMEEDVALSLKDKFSDLHVLIHELPEQYRSAGVGVAIAKDNHDLTAMVEKAVAQLNADGTVAKLRKKWFGGDGSDETVHRASSLRLVYTHLPTMLHGAWRTVWISFVALIMALPFGLLMGSVASDLFTCRFAKRAISLYVHVIRGTPLFVQILLIYFALPEITGLSLGPVAAGIIALLINSLAYLCEIVRGGINAIPKSQKEAAFTLGYTSKQALYYIVLPQTIRNILPALINEFVSLIKESSILMILGVEELMKVSRNIVASEMRPFEIYITTAVIYFVITYAVSCAARKIESRL